MWEPAFIVTAKTARERWSGVEGQIYTALLQLLVTRSTNTLPHGRPQVG
jgi:hypothetical protein